VQADVAKTGEYVLYVDESIVFGSEKILLILGIDAAQIPTDRAVAQTDMEVLFVGGDTTWKAEQIADELAQIAQTKRIRYVVSDEGLNLRKAYKSLDYTHIADCTHVFANHLRRIYEQDATFVAFSKLVGDLRKAWNLSKDKSAYMPPSMRGKLRFANIFPSVEWAARCLKNWDTLPAVVRESLGFLKENTAFIDDLNTVASVFKTVCAALKTGGFDAAQKATLDTYLANIAAQNTDSHVATFATNCAAYLTTLTQKSEAINQPHLLVSSDIIETFFGKFKSKTNPNNRSGLTEFYFTLANFTQPFSVEETKQALENIKIKDLKLPKKHPAAA
jgi:hypothetical protein